ncbi:uncharacterized protein [Lepidochelys kempii]|uniref:uncharacterized protein n=1 Tax=Lepidochelys kempii TaxID=8472 RepID=UPI003C6F432A
MPPGARRSPVWSNGEVLDLIHVWEEEAVQSQLRSSRRNYNTFGQISRAMMERGHDRDALQCRVKVKELRNAYHKAREANSRSGDSPATCRFFKELDVILGGDPTSTLKTTMDTSEAVAVQSSTKQEEESRREGAEETVGPEPEDSPASLDARNQELFSSQEEGSQSQWTVLREEQTAEEVPNATLRSQPSLLSMAKRLQRIRKRQRRTKEDLLHEVMQQSRTENQKVQEWRETERRLHQQNVDCRHQSTERLISIMEHQVDSMQVLVAPASPSPRSPCPKTLSHVTTSPLPPTSGFLLPPAASNTCSFTTQPCKLQPLPTALNPHHHAA